MGMCQISNVFTCLRRFLEGSEHTIRRPRWRGGQVYHTRDTMVLNVSDIHDTGNSRIIIVM